MSTPPLEQRPPYSSLYARRLCSNSIETISSKALLRFIERYRRFLSTGRQNALESQQPRQVAAQVLSFGLILSTVFMVRRFRISGLSQIAYLNLQMWKGLSVLTNSPSPIVVVLSGSMEPAFQRGDLLFLNNRDFMSEPGVGDIVVYNVDGKYIPIVHRIIQNWEGYVSSMRRSHLLFTHLL